MAQIDQTNVNEPVQDLRAEAWQEPRQDTSERASARQAWRDTESRPRDSMMHAVSTTEQLGSGVVSGVANVAGGVIGAVRDTANVAIDGVGSVGEHAVHALTGLLVEVVGGVRQIAGAAVGGARSSVQAASRAAEAAYREEPPYAPEVRREATASEQARH